MKINQQFTTSVAQALVLLGRVPIPAGVELVAIGISTSDDEDFDQFEVRGSIGGQEFTFASATADYETPVWPLKRASGDLTLLTPNTKGYVVLDVRGLTDVSVWAACDADGPTDVTVSFFG